MHRPKTAKVAVEKPITLYNADKKEVVGVFATPILAARYVADSSTPLDRASINVALAARRNGRMPTSQTKFSFPVAVRYANAEQTERLGNELFTITMGYPMPLEKRMLGASGVNRRTLAIESIERLQLARKYPSA